MTGSILDVINALQVRLFLSPQTANNEYVVLQQLTMPLTRNETREAVALGPVYFYSQHDNSFEATILLTAADISFYLTNNAFDAGGALAKSEYDIQLVGKSGTNVKIRVVAVTPSQDIEKLADGGVKIRQRFRITDEVDSGNIV